MWNLCFNALFLSSFLYEDCTGLPAVGTTDFKAPGYWRAIPVRPVTICSFWEMTGLLHSKASGSGVLVPTLDLLAGSWGQALAHLQLSLSKDLTHPALRGCALLIHMFKVRCEVVHQNSSGLIIRSCLLSMLCDITVFVKQSCGANRAIPNGCLQLPLMRHADLFIFCWEECDEWVWQLPSGKSGSSTAVCSCLLERLFCQSSQGNKDFYQLLLFLGCLGTLLRLQLNLTCSLPGSKWSCCYVVIFKHSPLIERSPSQNCLLLWFWLLLNSKFLVELVKSTSVSNRFCLLLFVRTSQKVCMAETSMFEVNSFFFSYWYWREALNLKNLSMI